MKRTGAGLLFTHWDAAIIWSASRTSKCWPTSATGSTYANGCQTTRKRIWHWRAQHTVHVHGRVGYAEGPQAPDPAAPEYAGELAWHEKQWKAIWDLREAAGDEIFTFTPEYGPPPYLHTLPRSNEPVADLWNICVWAMQRAREVFG